MMFGDDGGILLFSFKLCLLMGGVLGGNNLTSSKKSPTTQLFNRCQIPVKDPVEMEELPVELRIKELIDENYLAPNPSSGKPQKSQTNLHEQSNESLKRKKKSKTNLSTG